jgi:hypothetical protein
MQRRLEAHVFPYIGKTDVGTLTGPDLVTVLRRIESRGTYEFAHRVRSICSRVLRYGKATGRSCQDVAAELVDLLVPVQATHMAAITEPLRIGQLLRSIDGYIGEPLTRLTRPWGQAFPILRLIYRCRCRGRGIESTIFAPCVPKQYSADCITSIRWRVGKSN